MTLRRRRATNTAVRRWAILDTDVLNYWADPASRSSVAGIIERIVEKGYTVAISCIAVAEALDGADLENEDRIAEALTKLPQFGISRDIAVVAGHLGSLYNELGRTVGDIGSDLADKIIAGTAVLHDTLIVTGNGRHYPQPFFDIAHKSTITYEKKRREVCQYIYICKPDRSALRSSYNAPVRQMARPRRKLQS